jgi:hypothetical protein
MMPEMKDSGKRILLACAEMRRVHLYPWAVYDAIKARFAVAAR